jgi:hypothetical protein
MRKELGLFLVLTVGGGPARERGDQPEAAVRGS